MMNDPLSKYSERQAGDRCDECGHVGPWAAMAIKTHWCELCDSEETDTCPNCGPFRNYREPV